MEITEVKEYIELLESPPNGLGQHFHPIHGQSHCMLRMLYEKYGKDRVNDQLNRHYNGPEV